MLNRRSFIATAGLLGLGALLPAGPTSVSAVRKTLRADQSNHGASHEGQLSPPDRSALDDLLALERWEDLRDEADCREVVQHYLPPSVRLTRLSPISSSWIGPCPFCRSGCLEVIRELYACADCHVSGSPVEFIAHAESLTHGEALNRLAQMLDAGVLDGARSQYTRFWQVMEEATTFYHSLLLERPEGKPGREWAKRQGLTEAAIRRLRIGFGPSEPETLLRTHLSKRGYSDNDMRIAGLLGWRSGQRRTIDRHANDVLLVPVHDAPGRVWSLLEEPVDWSRYQEVTWHPKEGPLQSVRFERMVYPVPVWPRDFRRHDSLLLADRPLDVVLLREAGIDQVVCPVLGWSDLAVRTARAMADRAVRVQAGPINSFRMEEILRTFARFQDRIRLLHVPSERSLRQVVRVEGMTAMTGLMAASRPVPQILNS